MMLNVGGMKIFRRSKDKETLMALVIKQCDCCGDDYPMSSPNQRYCLPCSHALRGVTHSWRGEVMKKLSKTQRRKDSNSYEFRADGK